MSKKHIVLPLKFLVSGWLIWMLVSGIDLGSARDRILGADPTMLFLTLLVATIHAAIAVMRWRSVLVDQVGDHLA